MVREVGVGEVLARIPQNRPRPATLLVVCRVWPSCSKPRSPKDAGMLAEVTGTVSFGKDTKASSA